MDLRLGKNAVFFKDTFCLSKKKCTIGQIIHDTIIYGHEYLALYEKLRPLMGTEILLDAS